jgi:hypothetical protein
MAERLVKVRTFQTSDGLVSMWGTLHFNAHGGTVAGWLCDSWTESGTPYPDVLRPRLHWLSKEDNKFHLVKLDIPVAGIGSIALGRVDTDIEPRREKFMRDTLAKWENEYFTSEGVDISG